VLLLMGLVVVGMLIIVIPPHFLALFGHLRTTGTSRSRIRRRGRGGRGCARRYLRAGHKSLLVNGRSKRYVLLLLLMVV